MGVGRVGADQQDDVGLLDRLEVLRAGRRAERRVQPEAGRRVADAGTGVDVVVAERGAHHLLHDEHLFVRAARRGDAADRPHCRGAPGCRGTWPPYGRSLRPTTRSRHSSSMFSRIIGSSTRSGCAGVAPGEAALHARVAFVGAAVLVRHHPHDLLALHLGLERAADAAVRARRQHRAARLAQLDDRVLGERGRRADLHAGTARDAVGLDERSVGAGGDTRAEAAALDRERERALHLFAGTHAARAHDALRRVEREVRVGGVLREAEVVVARVAVAHVAQARPRRPCPAARSRRWRRRSGSRADGR